MSSKAETMKKTTKRKTPASEQKKDFSLQASHFSIPRLRFPEFRKAPGWEEKPVNAISDVNPNHDGLPNLFVYIDLESVEQGKLVAQKIINREGAPSRAQRLLRKRDVIYQTVRPYQRNNLFFDVEDERDYVASTGYAQLRAHASPAFLFQLLHTDDFVNKVLAKCTGSNYPAINSSDLAAIEVAVPSPPEQQKIAECLSSLDGLIATEGRKLAALRDHKRGLMQQLFPQPGQSQPRLRFPKFRNKGEWEEKHFGKLLKINSGKGFKASEYSYNGIRLLQIENVGYGKVKWNENTIYLPQNYIQAYPELVLRADDIVLALNRPITNDELKIAKLIDNDVPSLLYQRVGRIEKISDSISNKFILHICQEFIKEFVKNQSIGSDQPFISLRELYKQSIFIPSPSEQQKIADCLSALDTQITAQAVKIESLKTHKRGLMQQLFPSTEDN